jgi:hypothetical protein
MFALVALFQVHCHQVELKLLALQAVLQPLQLAAWVLVKALALVLVKVAVVERRKK